MLKESFQNEAYSSIKLHYYNGSYGYQPDSEIHVNQLTDNIIEPRVQKALEAQNDRTKTFAEVFTPSWICNQMNNYVDESWFGRKNVFNIEHEQTWIPSENRIMFSEDRPWTEYVYSRHLEIACGEAPFIVSRYDAATGNMIPLKNRIGILDRKLRIINENTDNEKDWISWAIKAFQSVYGYEFQGDNLLIARINLLMTFIEYLQDMWNRKPSESELKTIANIIVWNIWQMDGFTNTIPFSKATDEQLDLFSSAEQKDNDCLVYEWRGANRSVKYRFIGGEIKMKFDFAIGNPPYQQTNENTSDKPVYNIFMDSTFLIANKVELITPARFLFNAGKTPKEWNEKMLNDAHFKVLAYIQNSADIFPDTDIKGGVAITYRDQQTEFGSIKVFTHIQELQTIKDKVVALSTNYLDSLVYAPESYRFSQILHNDYPEIKYVDETHGILSKGHDYDLTTNIFDKLANIVFFDKKPNDGFEYIKIIGRQDNARKIMYIKQKYIENHDNLEKWKIILPKSNGSGALGEALSTPLIGHPLIGHTQSFISVGSFDSEYEAKSLLKYIKTKFARTMLGILKITQDNKKSVWIYVPLQDFTSNSDINWNVSIKEIDKQLYKKYGLSPEEVEFIETNVKEMV